MHKYLSCYPLAGDFDASVDSFAGGIRDVQLQNMPPTYQGRNNAEVMDRHALC